MEGGGVRKARNLAVHDVLEVVCVRLESCRERSAFSVEGVVKN